eukprot:7185517-Prymnesium_polylepis.1
MGTAPSPPGTLVSSTPLNVLEANQSGLGAWGGPCLCPDGNAYYVADNNDHCGSLACIGGSAGHCSPHETRGSYTRVICIGGPPPSANDTA